MTTRHLLYCALIAISFISIRESGGQPNFDDWRDAVDYQYSVVNNVLEGDAIREDRKLETREREALSIFREYLEMLQEDSDVVDIPAEEVSEDPGVRAAHRTIRIYEGVEELSIIEKQELGFPMLAWSMNENDDGIREIHNAIRADWLKKLFSVEDLEAFLLDPDAMRTRPSSRIVIANNWFQRLQEDRVEDVVEILCLIEKSGRRNPQFWYQLGEAVDVLNRPGPPQSVEERMEGMAAYLFDIERQLAFLYADSECVYYPAFSNAIQYLLFSDMTVIGLLSEETRMNALTAFDETEPDKKLLAELECALGVDFQLDINTNGVDPGTVELSEETRSAFLEYFYRNRDCFAPEVARALDEIADEE